MFLHGLAIAHRDIKMENIICNEDLTAVKFIDFGLCIDINEEKSQLSKEFCGTVSYMPPEIFERKPYDPKKADIWSLGVLLYKLAFDRYPYRGKDENEMLFKITRTKVVYPEYCNEGLKHLLERMLNRNASSRFSISEVIEHRWLL
jgi:serine/threonine protein kinase